MKSNIYKTTDLTRRSLLKRLTSIGALGIAGPGLLLSGFARASGMGDWLERLQSISFEKGSKNYEFARKSLIPWSIDTPNRFPEMIVKAETEDDVINAIRYARERQLKVGVRSSGHNTAGPALRDGGVMIDLSGLSGISIDPDKKTATIQPGVVSAQLLQEALQHGLAFPVANCPTVAMGGYLLGGGQGKNKAHYDGVACYSILNADIVLANGDRVTVSKDSHPELFWTIRGVGPGFFGVVTRFEIQLFPLAKNIHRSMYILPIDKIDVVISSLDKIANTKDHRTYNFVVLMENPKASAKDSRKPDKVCLISVIAFADSERQASKWLALYSHSDLAAKSIFKSENRESSILEYPPMPGPSRRLGDSVWINDSDALRVLAKHFESTPSVQSTVMCSYGVKAPLLRDDACFSMIGNHYIANYVTWAEKKDDEANKRWLNEAIRLLKPYTIGHYVNEVDGRHYPDRVQNSFSPSSWERLKQLRKKYDPSGVFYTYIS